MKPIILACVSTDTAATVYKLSSKQIVKFEGINSDNDTRIVYLDQNDQPRTIEITTALATVKTALNVNEKLTQEVTATSDGLVYNIMNERIISFVTNSASGSNICYDSNGAYPSTLIVNEAVATIETGASENVFPITTIAPSVVGTVYLNANNVKNITIYASTDSNVQYDGKGPIALQYTCTETAAALTTTINAL